MVDVRWSDHALEEALRGAAEEIAYADPEILASAVVSRIRAGAGRDRSTSKWFGRESGPAGAALRLRVAAVIIVLVALAAFALPGVRSAAADLVGLRGVRIVGSARPLRGILPPESGSLPVGRASSPTVSVRALGLGAPIDLVRARSLVPFPISLPTRVASLGESALPTLGPPAQVFVSSPPEDGEVTLVWAPAAGLPPTQIAGVGVLVSQFVGRLDGGFFSKVVGPGTTVEPVTVGGAPGFWLAGDPHQFLYTDAHGNVLSASVRLAGNVLLWQRGTVTLRLESGLGRDAAIALASTFST